MQKWEYLQAFVEDKDVFDRESQAYNKYVTEINGKRLQTYEGGLLFGKTVGENKERDNFLTNSGLEGWELVTIHPESKHERDGFIYTLKRPIEE